MEDVESPVAAYSYNKNDINKKNFEKKKFSGVFDVSYMQRIYHDGLDLDQHLFYDNRIPRLLKPDQNKPGHYFAYPVDTQTA